MQSEVITSGIVPRGKRAMAPQFFHTHRSFGSLMFRWKIFRLLLSVKTRVSNFIGKSLRLPPPPNAIAATTPLVTPYFHKHSQLRF